METSLEKAKKEFIEYVKNQPYIPARVINYMAELENRIRNQEKAILDLTIENTELKEKCNMTK